MLLAGSPWACGTLDKKLLVLLVPVHPRMEVLTQDGVKLLDKQVSLIQMLSGMMLSIEVYIIVLCCKKCLLYQTDACWL